MNVTAHFMLFVCLLSVTKIIPKIQIGIVWFNV